MTAIAAALRGDWAALARFATYFMYVGASGAALALDLGVFFALVWSGTAAPVAGGIGYSAGLLLHWFISSRVVFREQTGEVGSARRRQQAMLFVATAGLGLVLTVGVIAIADAFGAPPWLSKPLAVAVSFQSVWWVRRELVFAE